MPAIAAVTAYDPALNAWTALTSLPAARASGVAGVIAGEFYYTTGSGTATTYKGVPGTITPDPAPAAPTGLGATGSPTGIALDWADNTESDLAGYNVYRSTSATGTFTKVNASLVTTSTYNDVNAPAGAASFYRVTAVDNATNESLVSNTASATRPQPPLTTVRINTGGAAQTVGGVAWSACTALTACSGYVTGGFPYAQSPVPTITGMVSPANQAVYQTEWTGGLTNGVPQGAVAFTFGVPVTNGTYQVRLHFAELNKNGAGLRVFDVNIEGGANELTGFDVWTQAAGINKAIVREFTTTVTDGTLTIALHPPGRERQDLGHRRSCPW